MLLTGNYNVYQKMPQFKSKETTGIVEAALEKSGLQPKIPETLTNFQVHEYVSRLGFAQTAINSGLKTRKMQKHYKNAYPKRPFPTEEQAQRELNELKQAMDTVRSRPTTDQYDILDW